MEPDQLSSESALPDRVQPPIAAGPVTIQISPQGQVTISVNPLPAAPLEGADLEAITARGFGEWLRGEQPPDTATEPQQAGPVEEALNKLRAALKALGEKVEQFVADVSTLEVRTYVSDRLDQVDREFFTTSEPRALTYISLDGDTMVVVPLNAGQLDEALWRIHSETVGQAQAHREAMFKTVMELVRGLVPTIK
jgi:signal transduction histidine kinase